MKGVVNGAKWDECVDIEELNAIPLKSLGSRHYPISHGMVLESFKQKLVERGYDVVDEIGMLNRDPKKPEKDKLKYIYVVELRAEMSDYTFKLGFINYNNKERALTGIAGEGLFICSNECFQMFSGLVKSGKRKHTKNMEADLDEKLNDIFGFFEEYRSRRVSEIEIMKSTSLQDRNVASLVLDLHRNTSLAGSLIGKVINEWDEPSFDYSENNPLFDSRTMWIFLNACTHCIKQHENPLYRIEQQGEVNNIIRKHLGLM